MNIEIIEKAIQLGFKQKAGIFILENQDAKLSMIDDDFATDLLTLFTKGEKAQNINTRGIRKYN